MRIPEMMFEQSLLLWLLAATLLVWLLLRWYIRSRHGGDRYRQETITRDILSKRISIEDQASLNSQWDQPTVVESPSENIPQSLLDFSLISHDTLGEETRKTLYEMTDKMLRPRGLLNALMVNQSGPKELGELVSTDPEIAAKILRIVNSSAYGLSKKITSVQYAAVFLGTSVVRDITMRLCMQNSFEKKNDQLELVFRKFWQISMLASLLGQRLAQNLGFEQPAALSTRAMLSLLGNLAILSNYPVHAQRYASIVSLFERTAYEQSRWHMNSALVGSMLARKWQFPEEIEMGIRESLWPMCYPVEACPSTNLRELTFCYCCCRFSEQIILRNLDDVGECHLNPELGIEYYHLQGYLQKTRLDRLLNVLNHPKIQTELNESIRQLREAKR